jgi:hypothetical protein
LIVNRNSSIDLANFGTVDYAGVITASGGAAGSGEVLLNQGTIRSKNSGTTFNIPGTMLKLNNGTLDVRNASITNSNRAILPTSNTISVVGPGSFINSGVITHSGTGSLTLRSNATFENKAGATYNLTSDGRIAQSLGGATINAGTIRKSTGAVGAASVISTSLNNTGTITVGGGALTLSGAINQLTGTALTGGTWIVASGASPATLRMNTATNGITNIEANARVTLNGSSTSFPQLSKLAANAGSLTLLAGRSFTTVGDFVNTGRLMVDSTSKLTIGGTGIFTQSAAGTLLVSLGGTNTSPVASQLIAKEIRLGGKLIVNSTIQPPTGTSFTLVKNNGALPVSGTFANLPEGSLISVNGVSYRLSYVGNGQRDVTMTVVQ